MNPFLSKEIADSYDDWYTTGSGDIYDQLEKKAIYSLIKNLKKGSILEIGCGTGHWTEYFSALDFHVYGIDNSAAMIENAKQKNIRNAMFKVADAETFYIDKMFDHAAFITSLEFVNDPIKVIDNTLKYIKDDGHIILGILNKDSLLGKQSSNNNDPVFSNARFYSVKEIKNTFKKYGKTKIKTCAFITPVNYKKYKIKEILGKIFMCNKGNFIAGRIDLCK